MKTSLSASSRQIPSTEGFVEKETKEMKTKNLTATVASLVEKHGCAEADVQFKVQLRLSTETAKYKLLTVLLNVKPRRPRKKASWVA